MANYQEEYREALRRGDTEQANQIYREHIREDSVEENSEADSESNEEEIMEDPSSMTVDEAKEYADDLDPEARNRFLEMERNGKERATLVEYLEE